MAQLFFIYGTMNCGKSTQLLSTAHSYKEQGKSPLLLTPATDTRDGIGTIKSRIGLEAQAEVITDDFDLMNPNFFFDGYDVILVDEAQFLSAEQVDKLAEIVDTFNIPVLAYGLKNDFSNHLFTGSERLLLIADKLIEMKTTCRWCNHKAVMNLRLADNEPVYDGEQIMIGDNESYTSVCRHHYYHPAI